MLAKIELCSGVREPGLTSLITAGRFFSFEPIEFLRATPRSQCFKNDPEVATWSPSDSARIKQLTLIKRQPKKEAAQKV